MCGHVESDDEAWSGLPEVFENGVFKMRGEVFDGVDDGGALHVLSGVVGSYIYAETTFGKVYE